jgi:hypothetical protein
MDYNFIIPLDSMSRKSNEILRRFELGPSSGQGLTVANSLRPFFTVTN